MFLLVLAQAAMAVEAPQQGVVSYDRAYFAAQQPGTALDMIGRIPGFTLENGGAVRGFEGAAGNVLIDGQRPSTKSETLDELLRRVPASQVARIDVIRGGAPGVDMQGKTVLVNVIRVRGAGLKGLVEFKNFHVDDGRDSPGVRVEASGAVGERTWEVALRSTGLVYDGAADGPGRRVSAGGVEQRYYINSEGDFQQNAAAGAVETPFMGGRLRVNGRLFSSKYKEEENNPFFSPQGAVERQVLGELVTETEIGARYLRDLGAATKVEALALRQTRDSDLSLFSADAAHDSLFARNSDRTETIGRLVVKHARGPRLSLELGGEAALNQLDSATRVTNDGQAGSIPAANVEVEETRAEGFAKASWRVATGWTLDAALRVESSTISADGDVELEKTLNYVKPRLAAAWSATPGTQVRARLEREVGQLNFNDFVASASLATGGGVFAGNPDLNPARAWVVEAALEQRFWDAGSVTLTARHSALSDVIDRAPMVGASGRIFDAPANIGDGRKDELQLDATLPTDRLGAPRGQIRGFVRRGWSEVTDPTTHADRRISGYHPLEWTLSFSQDVPAWRMTWGGDLSDGFTERYYRFNQVETYKVTPLLRLYVEVKPRPDWMIHLDAFNPTKRGMRDYNLTYPGPRGRAGAPDLQVRDQKNGPFGLVLRVRKTFGG